MSPKARAALASLIDKFDALPMEERLKGNDRYGPHVADRSANLADYLLAHNYFDNSQMASATALTPSADRTTWEQAEAHFRNYISGPGAIAHRAIVQVATLTAEAERLNHEVAAWIEACGKAIDDRNGARAERDALRAALQPFADYVRGLEPTDQSNIIAMGLLTDPKGGWETTELPNALTLGACFRARAVLSAGEAP